jgi:very-short-patch-repair endonuclease
MGIKTLRINNEEVKENIVMVNKKIMNMISERKTFLSLSSKGEAAKPRGI